MNAEGHKKKADEILGRFGELSGETNMGALTRSSGRQTIVIFSGNCHLSDWSGWVQRMIKGGADMMPDIASLIEPQRCYPNMLMLKNASAGVTVHSDDEKSFVDAKRDCKSV